MTISARLSVIARKLSLKNWLTKPAASPLGEQSKTRLLRASINSARSPEPVEGLRRTECVYILLAMTIFIAPSPSYAYSDRDNADIYTKQSQYSPGWVMDSVYNPKAESGMKDSVDKLNQAENTQAIKQKNADNPDATAESKLPLKKKRSAGEGKADKTTTTVPVDTVNPINVINGKIIPDAAPNFLTPQKAKDMFNEEVKTSFLADKGIYTIKNAYGSGNDMNLWQAGENIMYEIRNPSGGLVRGQDYLGSRSSTDTNTMLASYLTQDPVQQYGGIKFSITQIYYRVTGDDVYGINYSAEKVSACLELFDNMVGQLVAGAREDANTYYSLNSGDYTTNKFTWASSDIINDPASWSTLVDSTSGYSHGNSPAKTYDPTASTTTTITTLSYTQAPYRPYSKYDYTSLDYTYNQYKTNQSNDSNTPTSLSKAKDDKALDKANSNINPNSLNKDNLNDYKLINPYLIDLSFLDPSSLKTKTTELEDMVLVLDQKESKTKIEEDILTLAKTIEENIAYLDKDTIKDFNEVVRMVTVMEDMKAILSESDFANIDKSLTKLVEDQRGLYNDYLTKTESVYQKLEAILGIDIDNDLLPDAYIPLAKANVLAKKKIAIDLALERLKAKELSTLSDNEKLALNINQELLSPIRNEYINKLKMSITSFVWDIRDMTKGKEPVSILKDDTNLNTMFMLKDEPIVQQ